jgi:predicted RNA-binding protein YlxR (DUF448 family)
MTRDAQAAMMRLAAVDGVVRADERRRLGGRGGYLHPRRECLERFARARTREFRSLRVALDRGARDLITRMLQRRLDSQSALN